MRDESSATLRRTLRRLRGPALLLTLAAAAAGLGLAGGGGSGPEAPERARPLAVTAPPVALEPGYEREQRFVGRVEFAQASALSFELGGRVARVHVDEGAAVEAGAVLAELDTARLRARRAELRAARDEARAQAELAALRNERAQRLLAEEVIAPQRADDTRLESAARAAALERVEAAIARVDVDLAKSRLRAPFAGAVAARHADAGVVVEAGQPVLRLLETGRPEVRVGVTRAVAAQLAEGQAVTLRIAGAALAGRVLGVVRERARETRTVPVRIAVESDGAPLREGDLAELAWRERVESEGFWLPRAALTEGARGLWVVYAATPQEGALASGAAPADAGMAPSRAVRADSGMAPSGADRDDSGTAPSGADRDGSPATPSSALEPDSADPVRRLERRPVELLYEAGDRVFVRGALRPGDAVVREGVHRLAPGQLVRRVDAEATDESASLARAVSPEPRR